ncbi:ATP-dependent protease La [Auriscalpium vulgare]|uniref:ATP-dependent protease La n=1 Tax=Auriscalpium vulgare TaxID=40419 RepID=A0ACB8RM36_9AGAM|nr:ATP-dependent protease La [Auriscalpium vulgare]
MSVPTLALPYPLLLLPSARVTLPISQTQAEDVLELVEAATTQPSLAAVPVLRDTTTLNEWGVNARITRLVRPRRPTDPHMITLQGFTRLRLTGDRAADYDRLPLVPVAYPPSESKSLPSTEAVNAFRSACAALLERLAQSGRKRETWARLATLVDETENARAAGLADLVVAAVGADYEDKLILLSTPNPTERLHHATTLLTKQLSIAEVTTKIASAVDASLSKQQKELFLRQQLSAIQAELQSLQGLGTSVAGAGNGEAGSELDHDAEGEDELAEVKRKIEALATGSEVRRVAVSEWRRLKRITPQSAEHGVVRTYLEWLTSLPWPTDTSPSVDDTLTSRSFLKTAQAQLDADHFGLDTVKRRLIEYLAVVRLRAIQARATADTFSERDPGSSALVKIGIPSPNALKPPLPPKAPTHASRVKGPILLFVGPPGTGKTSLGQSIARALQRPFQRIALGGVRDEAEVRGHRRTYVASGPGLVVQAMRKAGRMDPVVLLDEIDKVGHSNFHGDPAAALLEVLDPEQNHTFNASCFTTALMDHYINVPVDLSQVLFICTANTLDTIAAPLLDRCEVVHISGYTYDEKRHIARRFLLPKQLNANGLASEHVDITEPALLHVVTHYTREAGVRGLERTIGSIVRFKAVEWAEHLDETLVSATVPTSPLVTDHLVLTSKHKPYRATVEEHELEQILGIGRWDGDQCEREARRGVVYGLVVTGTGEGEILPVETIAVPGGGVLKLTGSLGAVIKESGELALSWVKTHAYELRVTGSRAHDPLRVPHAVDVHLHLPAGAQKKDGPSAGIAMVCALVSLLTGACVPAHVAMSGEITLRERVTPVGGIKEKVLGAHRAQITKVILPYANRKDVEHDVPVEVRQSMQFVFVRTVREAIDAAFGAGTLGWRSLGVDLVESRL